MSKYTEHQAYIPLVDVCWLGELNVLKVSFFEEFRNTERFTDTTEASELQSFIFLKNPKTTEKEEKKGAF